MPTTIISICQLTSGASLTSVPPDIHKRPLSGQPVSKIIVKFQYLIINLLESVPEASADDTLAIFEEDPKKFNALSLNAEELMKQGVSEAVFEGKLLHLLGELKKL